MKRSLPSPSSLATVLAPFEASLAFWRRYAHATEIWCTRHGVIPVASLAKRRLQALVDHVRVHSPLYGRLYAGLPRERVELARLPIVKRQELMAHFDDWATDRAVTRAAVRRFLASRERIGAPFLDRYHVWKSSGTSGDPGIFVQDAHALAAYDALVAAQFDTLALGDDGLARLVAGGGRAALVAADTDHFAAITSWQRFGRVNQNVVQRAFSVLAPMRRLVAGLNGFRPAFLAAYPSVLGMLAEERRAGRLDIAPALVWSGGERLGQRMREAIERAFGCPVVNEYGSSECLAIAYECAEGWLHVNCEWVILEGVDRDGRPVAPGELSHTTLLTNLANWLQPVIRYDLGDRIVAMRGPCACGSPLPAVRVEGRRSAPLQLRDRRGTVVRLPPLALETVVEQCASSRRFQVVQSARDQLSVRFAAGEPSPARLWRRAGPALRTYLASQGLANVSIRLDREPPRIDRASGKTAGLVIEPGCDRED